MKEEIAIKEKLKLTEQELNTVVDKLQELESKIADLAEANSEIKAIKMYLARVYPDFKKEFADVCRKLNIKETL